jgi:maleylacetoacetate isomerase
MITLYDYWRSSASYRVRIALNMAEGPWQSVPVDLLTGVQKSAGHLARNPQGLVPAVELDGQVMTQSLAIIEYLDETRGLRLLPAEPLARARVRALAYAIAMDIHPICNLGVARHAVEQSAGAITMAAWMEHFIAPGLLAVEQMLDGGAFCHGDRVSLADLCLMPQVYNARRWGIDLAAMPRICRIEAHLAGIPAFAEAHPDRFAP